MNATALPIVLILALLTGCATTPRIPTKYSTSGSALYRVEHRVLGLKIWTTTWIVQVTK